MGEMYVLSIVNGKFILEKNLIKIIKSNLEELAKEAVDRSWIISYKEIIIGKDLEDTEKNIEFFFEKYKEYERELEIRGYLGG